MSGGVEAFFTIRRDGDRFSLRGTLSELLQANQHDEDLCDWLRRTAAKGQQGIGATLRTGGGAAPRCEIRRVA